MTWGLCAETAGPTPHPTSRPLPADRGDVAASDSDVALHRRIATAGFSPDDFETRQIFATSKDGTRVPMFVVSRTGLVLDGSAPTLLYG